MQVNGRGVDAGKIAGLVQEPRDSIFSENEKRPPATNQGKAARLEEVKKV